MVSQLRIKKKKNFSSASLVVLIIRCLQHIIFLSFQEVLDTLYLQLEEKHSAELASLRSSMSLYCKEELQQVKHGFLSP